MGLTGLLGGLISSTALTLGFAQRSRQEPAHARPLALGILISWTVMVARVAVVLLIINARLAMALAPRLGLFAAASLLSCALLVFRRPKRRAAEKGSIPPRANPFALGPAIRFGLLFGGIQFAAKAAEKYLGTAGLYLTGALAGLTDVDAITLSMAELASRSPDSITAAARTVLIAITANTALKTGMVAFLGDPALRRAILPYALLTLAAGVGAILV
jgi:uncharacterized membrane protein (DUF4010 family)